jgi:hypothetical protein
MNNHELAALHDWRKRLARALHCTIGALAFTLLATTTQAHEWDRVLPPGAVVGDRTIGEWTGVWWRKAIEAVDFPFPAGGSQPGALGDLGGPVFFAVASPGPGATTYTYTIAREQYVLLPLYTYVWMDQTSSDPCSDLPCARSLSDAFVRATTSLSVSIDGQPIRHLFRHFEATPRLFYAPSVPVDGWWAGGDPAAAGLWFGFTSGYWLMLKPLSPGKHVVSVAVDAPYSSVCADGSQNCVLPSPGPPQVSATTLIITVPCNERDRGDRAHCRQGD